MQILVLIGTVGASPQIGEILQPCDFVDCPVLAFFSRERAQVELLNRFSRFMAQTTCFRTKMVLLGVRSTGGIFGEICPQNSPKIGVNRQLQAKAAKDKNRIISKTIHRIRTKFEDQADTGNCTS